MPTSAEARDWAPGALRGIIDSLYTPFTGEGGEELDEEAFRTLVAHCVGALDHDGIWVGGLVGEAWALSVDERKRLLEIAVQETRAIKPGALIEACPVGMAAESKADGFEPWLVRTDCTTESRSP